MLSRTDKIVTVPSPLVPCTSVCWSLPGSELSANSWLTVAGRVCIGKPWAQLEGWIWHLSPPPSQPLKWLHKLGFQVGILGAILGAEAPSLSSMGLSFQLLTYTACLFTKSQKIIKKINIEKTYLDEGKLQYQKCLMECCLYVQHCIKPSPTLSFLSLQTNSWG